MFPLKISLSLSLCFFRSRSFSVSLSHNFSCINYHYFCFLSCTFTHSFQSLNLIIHFAYMYVCLHTSRYCTHDSILRMYVCVRICVHNCVICAINESNVTSKNVMHAAYTHTYTMLNVTYGSYFIHRDREKKRRQVPGKINK